MISPSARDSATRRASSDGRTTAILAAPVSSAQYRTYSRTCVFLSPAPSSAASTLTISLTPCCFGAVCICVYSPKDNQARTLASSHGGSFRSEVHHLIGNPGPRPVRYLDTVRGSRDRGRPLY